MPGIAGRAHLEGVGAHVDLLQQAGGSLCGPLHLVLRLQQKVQRSGSGQALRFT